MSVFDVQVFAMLEGHRKPKIIFCLITSKEHEEEPGEGIDEFKISDHDQRNEDTLSLQTTSAEIRPSHLNSDKHKSIEPEFAQAKLDRFEGHKEFNKMKKICFKQENLGFYERDALLKLCDYDPKIALQKVFEAMTGDFVPEHLIKSVEVTESDDKKFIIKNDTVDKHSPNTSGSIIM